MKIRDTHLLRDRKVVCARIVRPFIVSEDITSRLPYVGQNSMKFRYALKFGNIQLIGYSEETVIVCIRTREVQVRERWKSNKSKITCLSISSTAVCHYEGCVVRPGPCSLTLSNNLPPLVIKNDGSASGFIRVRLCQRIVSPLPWFQSVVV